MADVITRFKLETTQFDSKLRDTAKGLKEIAETAKNGGKDFNGFSQKAVEAARALGTVASGATNTKDKLRDLVGSYNDAVKAYDLLSDKAKQDEFGKAMAASLNKLKQDIKDTKKELYGLGNASGSGGLFGGDSMKGMLQVFGGNMMTKAAGLVADMAMNMGELVNQSIEMSKSAEGVRMAFDRLNQPDILDNLREATHNTVSDFELMKAAVRFNDFKLPLDELGTMLAFAQQKAKDTGQSIDYMVDSIVMGLGRQSKQILDNLGISASEIKDKMAETGDMTKAVGEIIREQMTKAGDYVETAADRAAKANIELENEMLNLGNAMRETFGYTGWDDMANGLKTHLVQILEVAIEDVQRLKNVFDDLFGSIASSLPQASAPKPQGRTARWGDSSNDGVAAPGGYVEITDTNTGAVLGGKHFGNIDDLNSIREWRKSLTKKSGGGKSGKSTKTQQTEVQQNQTKINTLTQEYVKLGDQATDSARKRQEEIQKEIQALEKRNGLLKLREEQAHGKLNSVNVDMSVLSGSPSLDAWWKNRKNSPFPGLTKEGQKAIERQQKNFYKNLGKDGKEEKSFTQVADQMVGGISQMVGGLEKIGIELPEGFQSILSGISGVIEVLQAINIIVEAINVALTVGTFLGIFAHGGVVPHAQSGLNVVGGTHYSGDVTPILANAGEVVLNNAQVQNLANNLQNGGGQQSIRVYGIMRGKDIVLTSDNYLKSVGKGQFVTTRNRKN